MGKYSVKEVNPDFPSSRDELIRAIGDRIPTKAERGKAWTKRNVPDYREMIERWRAVLVILFPGVLADIIIEYIFRPTTATWPDITTSQ